jgi:hypothetical protein
MWPAGNIGRAVAPTPASAPATPAAPMHATHPAKKTRRKHPPLMPAQLPVSSFLDLFVFIGLGFFRWLGLIVARLKITGWPFDWRSASPCSCLRALAF